MRHPTPLPPAGTPCHSRRVWPVWIALLTLGLVAPAWAQDAAPAATTAAQEQEKKDQNADEKKLSQYSEEIVVTARKREENVQEVPVAISVLPVEKLDDAAASDISEIQSSVPNLSLYSGRNQSTTLTAFLRGVGQADPLWGVDPGVGLYLDDVYVARPQGALLDVFDVGRIEVLRGPQGTLYGKNTIGGAIKYVSSDIGERPAGQVSLTGGSYGNQDFKALFSSGFADGKLRAKFAFASLKHDGYGKNLYTGREVSDKDTLAYRFGLDWLPSDNVKLRLSYDHTKDSSEPKGLTRLQANPFCVLFLGAACPPEKNIFDTRSGLEPLNGTTGSGYAANLSWKVNDGWTFKSITAYRESDSKNNIDFDTTPAKIADAVSTYFDKQASEELQMVYDGGGKLSGVFGVFYFHGKAGGLVRTIFLNSILSVTDGDTITDSLALFGDGSYRVTDRLTLDFGLRATQEEKHTNAFNTVNGIVYANFDKKKTFDSVAPKLGLNYAFSPEMMGYFSVSRGFKSGGFNVRAQSNLFPKSAEPFDDEILDMGEVGVKSTLADGKVVLNLATFYGKYRDVQVSTFTSYDSNGDGVDDAFFGNFLNAGDATLKGAELEFTVNTDSWFGMGGNLSYLDAKPDTFLDANRDGFVDTQVITNAPKVTGAVHLDGRVPLFGGLLSGSVAYAYRDDSTLTNEGGQYPGRPGTPLLPLTQKAYGTVEAWIGWLSPNGQWRFGVSGKNLADEEYLTNGYNLPSFGIVQGSYGAPRTVLATVEFRFF